MTDKTPYGDVSYADPGYQADGKKRYPVDSAEHVRAAWSYINVIANARKYSGVQLAAIKSRIMTAAKKYGVDVHAEAAVELARLRGLYAPYIVGAEASKKRHKKHSYVAPHAGWFGPSVCMTCGQSKTDPDHDGDVDGPGPDNDAPQQAAGPVDENGQPNGCMVAFYPTPDLAQQLAVAGGEPADELHVTLAFLGTMPPADQLEQLKTTVAAFAKSQAPVTGVISGTGTFTAGEQPVTYASIDCPDLPEFRQALVDALTKAGFPPNTEHGFTPHMSISYAELADLSVPNAPLEFGMVWLCAGADRHGYTLGGPEAAALKQKHPAGYDAETEVIRQNRKHPNAAKKHPFRASEVPNAAGDSRCLLCGGSQPNSGFCNPDAETMAHKPGAIVVPIAASDDSDAAKIAAGIDAGVDEALTLLRSCKNEDLPPYAQQARDLLQGIEPACDALLAYFGVSDPDDQSETAGSGIVTPNITGGTSSTWTIPYAFTTNPVATSGTTTTSLFRLPDAAVPAPNEVRAYMQTVGNLQPSPATTTMPRTKAFIAEINGKTILTTQASTELAGAMTNHEHYLWTSGRLVGADEPNRNGAYWSSGDLELGQTTVPYGPLNWLHEEKHVIGSIAAASYSQPGETSNLGAHPNHIAIAAPVWRWLYPDEAAVVEMASEAGKFWYSMECISKEVSCIGDTGCGAQVPYGDYIQGINGTCQHMIERSGVRRFVDPVFLGAAIIIPPVRPGWAGADAMVMQQAAKLAEKAFDAAGRPDIAASEWEMLMAEVVRSATA